MYFDNAATTRVSDRVVQAMTYYLTEAYGNPSSLHAEGLKVEKALRRARQQLAEFIGASPKQLIFTSGATESSNLILQSLMSTSHAQDKHMITTRIEHPSVLEVFKHFEALGIDVTYLPVTEAGVIEESVFLEALKPNTAVISIMLVNNEIGSVQAIERLCTLAKARLPEVFFHTDAVQALGKIPLSMEKLGVDAASFSAHKLHGPKGVGLLYLKHPTRCRPLVYGGAQEGNIRSGTENIPGIMGFHEAILEFNEKAEAYRGTLKRLKMRFCDRMAEAVDDQLCLSPVDELHSDAIATFAFKDIKSEVLVHTLEIKGYSIASGSACSSNKKKAISHVMQGIGLPKPYQEGVVRISFSDETSDDAIDGLVSALQSAVQEQRDIKRWRKK